MLGGLNIKLLSVNDFPYLEEVVEDGRTFEENALKKAKYVCEKTGLPALADDSGLEVEALGGAPGVFSARYAGEKASDEDNVKKLLKEMEGVPFDKRKARFVCCIALVFPDGEEKFFWGYVKGHIIFEPRGNLGFGYDPVFIPEGHKLTFAEMLPDEKDRLSHRREALDKLKEYLLKYAELYK
ncbi:MAG: RdgB/HAM1 family non-canonical purine NTP pyrophosphatase, partial [Thermodesulfovibrionales bacterium]|nr:RdgB/HAM1 family non-canonical purine NTP pyrophosphatase [Thermodesulfovibrionales bacterium]